MQWPRVTPTPRACRWRQAWRAANDHAALLAICSQRHAQRPGIEVPRSAEWPLDLGQVLNRRQEVKPAMRAALLAGLADMDIDAPWKVFPYQRLVATHEVGAFYERLL